MSFFSHAFEGVIERFGIGKTRKIWYKVLFLPPVMERELPFDAYPRLRVLGEIAEVPVAGAFLPTGDGRRYFIVSPTVCREARMDVGRAVEMRFAIDDQDRVDLPDILADALADNSELAMRWNALTAGKRRGLVHPILAAKSEAVRQKRLEHLIRTLSVKDG